MSGGRREVFNLGERAVTPDHNRTQRFTGFERAELLGMLLGSNPSAIATQSTSTTPAAAIGTPLQGHVLNGLMVIAEVGGDDLGVQQGEVLLYDPDGLAGSSVSDPANPDDSSWKLVRDVGFAIGSGTLTLTANVSGATRWDVIECRRQPGVVIETDTRDVFDEVAGVFIPTLVNKYSEDQLEYRIRSSAVAPAAVQGWLPLAVACVPNLAATWDTCTIYDVRPLVRERRSVQLAMARSLLPKRSANLWLDMTPATEASLKGVFESEDPYGYYAGGFVRYPSAPFNAGIDRDAVDLFDPTFHEPGLVVPASGLTYVWLLFPYGLPRWRIYSAGVVAPFGGRVPQGLCGIPVVSLRAPTNIYGTVPNAAIAMPPISGLPAANTTTLAMLVTPVATNAANDFLYFVDDGDWHATGMDTVGGGGSGLLLTPATAVTATADFFDLVVGTHFPRNAKALLIQFSVTFTGAAATVFEYVTNTFTAMPGSTTQRLAYSRSQAHQITMPGAGNVLVEYTCEIQIPQDPTLSPLRVGVDYQQNGGIAKAAGSRALVLGWRT